VKSVEAEDHHCCLRIAIRTAKFLASLANDSMFLSEPRMRSFAGCA
jgi:hypothetical protein